MKRCTNCKEEKNKSDYRLRKGKGGNNAPYYNSVCRECEKEAKRNYRLTNLLKCRQSEKKWKLKNKDKVKAQQKRSCDKNKIKNTQRAKEHYYNNKGKRLLLVKIWKRLNKEKVKLYRKTYEEKYNSILKEKRNYRSKIQVKQLKSRYLKSLLKKYGFQANQITDEIIEVKRLTIKIKRYVKEKTGKKHSGA